MAYAAGAVLHFLDVLSLRLPVWTMGPVWIVWIWFLLIFDSLAALGLWFKRPWGEYAFLSVASSQLMAYVVFGRYFGPQTPLIVFHLVTIGIYFYLKFRASRRG